MIQFQKVLFVSMSLISIAFLNGCTKAKSTDDSNLSSGLFPETNVIAFDSSASNLIDGVNTGLNGYPRQVFQRNLKTGEIILVSKNEANEQANNFSYFPSQSGDGSKVSFISCSTNLVESVDTCQVYVKDMSSGKVEVASAAEDGTLSDQAGFDFYLKISPDGNRTAFMINATNLVENPEGKYLLFVKDITSKKLIRVDTTKDGVAGNSSEYFPASLPCMNLDGSIIGFTSNATNLIDGVNSGLSNVYIKNFDTGEVTLVSSAADGSIGNGGSDECSLSADGKLIAFNSKASNLVPDDTNGDKNDVFIKNLETGEVMRIGNDNTPTGMPSLSSTELKSHFGLARVLLKVTPMAGKIFIC